MTRPVTAFAALAATLLTLAACGGRTARPTLDVVVTAALQTPFGAIAERYTGATVHARYGTDGDLATAVRDGHGGDLVVSADLATLTALAGRGLVQPPTVFGSDRVVVAYHAVAGRAPFTSLADLVTAGVHLEQPAPGSDFAAACTAALATLPPAQATALDAGGSATGATSDAVLADVLAGRAAAGLVLQSAVDAAVRTPAGTGLGGRLAFGATIAYSAAVVTPPADADAAQQRRAQAAATLLFQLVQADQTPAAILGSAAIGAPPARPYVAPRYTPTGNQGPTSAPSSATPTPGPTYRFTPSSAPTP